MKPIEANVPLEFWTYKCPGCRLEMNWERERYLDGPKAEDLKACPQCDTPIDRTKLELTSI
jgi:endogenous inhibitor of DNA gyrase (YacG/DUF329 family)